MKNYFNGFLGLLYVLMFFSLIALTVWCMWLITPYIVYFYLVMMVLMFMRFALGVRNYATKYALNVMLSIDQQWQVIFSPLLNIGIRSKHKFGSADETASSVVGKNLVETGQWRWKFIELMLSILLEGGRPHSVRSIEHDEGY